MPPLSSFTHINFKLDMHIEVSGINVSAIHYGGDFIRLIKSTVKQYIYCSDILFSFLSFFDVEQFARPSLTDLNSPNFSFHIVLL